MYVMRSMKVADWTGTIVAPDDEQLPTTNDHHLRQGLLGKYMAIFQSDMLHSEVTPSQFGMLHSDIITPSRVCYTQW